MVAPTIFVFGSNLAGRHGAGSARYAREHWGAQHGIGRGRTGNAYAIPTQDANLDPLPLLRIRIHVDEFIAYATRHPHLHFQVTAIGTGLAGYSDGDVAPLFAGAPGNCTLPVQWRRYVNPP